MKKLLLILTLSTFVAPMAMNTYAAANGTKIELNDDDKKKKRKKKKSCCASETKACGTTEQKSCCSKKAN
jgi:hypothetical protein